MFFNRNAKMIVVLQQSLCKNVEKRECSDETPFLPQKDLGNEQLEYRKFSRQLFKNMHFCLNCTRVLLLFSEKMF